MTTWNDVRKHAGDKYPRRMLTPELYKEGSWVCHSSSSRWFKLLLIDGDMVGGFDFHQAEVIVPWAECYTPWDPTQGKVINK